jgi:hypothetical protein
VVVSSLLAWSRKIGLDTKAEWLCANLVIEGIQPWPGCEKMEGIAFKEVAFCVSLK